MKLKEVDIMARLAERLKEALLIRHMKQSELANATGINKSMISNYLSGRFEPKSENLNKLADALQVSEIWLAGYDVDMVDVPSPRNYFMHEVPTKDRLEFFDRFLGDSSHADWMPHRTETLSKEEMDIITAYRDADERIRTAIRTLLGVSEDM